MTQSDGIPDDPADDSNRNHTGKMSDSVRPDPLVEAVQEYMAALESGQRPSRKDFLARHADIADDLAACLDGLAFVHSAAAQLHEDSETGAAAGSPSPGRAAQPHPDADPATSQPLGDFRLVREIGRGGMGVVYEAVQLSLGRRVAVKVLPLAAAFDQRHLQRFHNEAQAAAQLHHTNIVPVYAVGCERGVHFYAMQLIEGQSLDEIIRELRKAERSQEPDGANANGNGHDGNGNAHGKAHGAARAPVVAAATAPAREAATTTPPAPGHPGTRPGAMGATGAQGATGANDPTDVTRAPGAPGTPRAPGPTAVSSPRTDAPTESWRPDSPPPNPPPSTSARRPPHKPRPQQPRAPFGSSAAGTLTTFGAGAPTENLTALRSAKRLTFYQSVARLGLQAAEALQYAHTLGVVHRDIKPANLLLDVRGNLWVTDFGLAQFYADDGGITRTGDILGTLRYMSPEQAGGRAVVLDQRTDVYSLGMTLYEMLTLERALPGETREQLLHQIGSVDPRPPRSIDKSIPVELETILTKATAKDVRERYASAGALADDLRRFLNDEPILARPPSAWDKAVKWTRRHKAVTLSAVAMLVLTAVGLLISTVLIAKEQGRTKGALVRERDRAREANEQRQLAEISYNKARQAVDYFARMAEEADSPERFFELRKEMLEAALVYYQGFIDERKDDPRIGAQLAESQRRVTAILRDLTAWEDLFRTTTLAELLPQPSVREALGLTATAEADGTTRFRPGFWFGMLDGDPRQMTPEQRLAAFDKVNAQIEADIAAALSPQQVERLHQIHRQVRGPDAFTDPDVAARLALTAAQKEAIRDIQDRLRRETKFRGPPSGEAFEEADQKRRDAVARIVALLSPDQAMTWARLIGDPFTGKVFLLGPRSGGPGRPPGPGKDGPGRGGPGRDGPGGPGRDSKNGFKHFQFHRGPGDGPPPDLLKKSDPAGLPDHSRPAEPPDERS